MDSYNDYYPFGEQMPNRNLSGSSDGRYKYSSKELDAETGLYHLGARSGRSVERKIHGDGPACGFVLRGVTLHLLQ